MGEENPAKVRIGELLLREGFISEKQLHDAIEIQKKLNGNGSRPLGEICVELNYISKPELQQILKKYKKRLYLGELLINLGLLNREEIDRALETQKIEGKKLGKILVESGYITEVNLINTLSTQLGIPKIIPSAGLFDPGVLKGVSRAFLQKNDCLPVFRNGDSLTVIMSDPLSEETLRTMENVFKCKVEPAIASSEDIQNGIKLAFDDLRMVDAAPEKSSRAVKNLIIGDTCAIDRNDDNCVEIVNFIISSAIVDGATDIHIEPMENMLRIRYRIDGVLQHKTDLPLFMASTLVGRIKAICGLDISDKRRHQDGRLGARVKNKGFDLRVSTYATINGESVAIRILPNQSNLMDLEMLGLSPTTLNLYRNVLTIPSGVIMVTGPSGCGKTTTLYASLRHLNGMDRKIITVEDPIEYTIDGVVQGQISEKTGLTYSNFIKSILRQDPDIIMIGEIRDKDSAGAVIEASLTGHKVLTSFHTDDSVGALLRMFEIGIETFLISSTVMSVLSQRLVRTLCPNCKEPYVPDDRVLDSFDSIRPINLQRNTFYTAHGCIECNNSGFKGRTILSEMLVVNNDIRDAILDRAPSSKIRSVARQSAGLVSMKEDGFYKAAKGVTSLEEVLRVVPYNECDAALSRSCEEVHTLCEGRC